MLEDIVFCIRKDEWQVRINGKVLPHIWNSKGAALAGLQTEQRRQQCPDKGDDTA